MAAAALSSWRVRSVSSSLRCMAPPVWRAASQLKRAVRMLPKWRRPVGLGANRVVCMGGGGGGVSV